LNLSLQAPVIRFNSLSGHQFKITANAKDSSLIIMLNLLMQGSGISSTQIIYPWVYRPQ
jgi:hypothetical protein